MSHTCHAFRCTKVVPPKMFMCAADWRCVRPVMQRAVWKEYRRGQEIDKNPSTRYLAVTFLAIAEVAYVQRVEGYERACRHYYDLSEESRLQAIADGQGDPLEHVQRVLPAQLTGEAPALPGMGPTS